MRISVITRWYNEEVFAPFFLRHYAWADEIVVMLDTTTTDGTEKIIGGYENTLIERFDHGGVIDDGRMAMMMSNRAADCRSDWVVYVDADEFIFASIDEPNPRSFLEKANGNVIFTYFRWAYQHRSEGPLDPERPVLEQRRHGGSYTLFGKPNMEFMKPCIVRPEIRVKWSPGTHGFESAKRAEVSDAAMLGVHWQLADVEEAVRRMVDGREKRLSEENIRHGWGVRHLTEAKIREECRRHLDDGLLFPNSRPRVHARH